MTLDRDQIAHREKVVVQQTGDHVHEERVVQNVNLEYREAIYKVTQFIWLLFGGVDRNQSHLVADRRQPGESLYGVCVPIQ
jgi:hypothetical protein